MDNFNNEISFYLALLYENQMTIHFSVKISNFTLNGATEEDNKKNEFGFVFGLIYSLSYHLHLWSTC